MPHVYETNGAAIYAESFATIRVRSCPDTSFSRDEESVVVRMIHAAGMVGLEEHVRFLARYGRNRACRTGSRARQSSAMPIWCRKASRALACPRKTR